MMKSERRERGFRHPFLIHFLCAAAVVAAAVFVRMVPGSFLRSEGKVRDAYTDDDGLPYMTDLDAYYHARLVDNYLRTGSLGDSVSKSGAAWDTKSHYPEGRSAAYQPGIVWLTAGVWRVLGGDLAELEYRLGAFVAALAALAAYLFGWRLSRTAGGVAAGLLVGCAPVYAARTCFGRFDTDMFVVLMEVLLIWFLTEALRAVSLRAGFLFASGFALCAWIYSLCWTPTYGMFFVALTLFGGFLSCFAILFDGSDSKSRAARFFRQPGLVIVAAAGILCVPGLLLFYGPSVFQRIIKAFLLSAASSGVSTGTGVGADAGGGAILPNLLGSISELKRAPFFRNTILSAFSGRLSGSTPFVVNGLGGAAVLILCLAGFIWLLLSAIPRFRNRTGLLFVCSVVPARDAAICFCVLGSWLIAGLYLSGKGIRFAEHLSIPVGLLAGSFIGAWFCEPGRSPHLKMRIASLVCGAAALIPALSGAALTVADHHPSVTDASVKAMRFIQKNAKDEDAVVASWWDMGYFYQSESGHPALWDGGTQNDSIRGLLVSKALTADDLNLSRRILLMLSTSGNSAVEYLIRHTDEKTTFDALYEALVLKKEEGLAILQDRCSLGEDEAEEVWAMMRPEVTKEAYLVLTYTMTRQIGWYEYYAGWDFTGTQEPPSATWFSYTPEGTPLFRSEEGQEYLADVREKETIWRLFFNAEPTPCFTPVYEWHDGLEHVRVWKIEE